MFISILSLTALAGVFTGIYHGANTSDVTILDSNTNFVSFTDSNHGFNVKQSSSGYTFYHYFNNEIADDDYVAYTLNLNQSFVDDWQLNYNVDNPLLNITCTYTFYTNNQYYLAVNTDLSSLNGTLLNVTLDINFDYYIVEDQSGIVYDYTLPYHFDFSTFNNNVHYFDSPIVPYYGSQSYYYYLATTFSLSFYYTDNIANELSFGAYQNGYNQGYGDAEGSAYQLGYNDGYSAGNIMGSDAGYANGYNDGFSAGAQSDDTILTLVGALIDTPILYLRKLFGYELFGISVFGVLTTLIGIIVALSVFRIVRNIF